ncbi:non-specific lipid-transfer protein, partial [Lasius niger]
REASEGREEERGKDGFPLLEGFDKGRFLPQRSDAMSASTRPAAAKLAAPTFLACFLLSPASSGCAEGAACDPETGRFLSPVPTSAPEATALSAAMGAIWKCSGVVQSNSDEQEDEGARRADEIEQGQEDCVISFLQPMAPWRRKAIAR